MAFFPATPESRLSLSPLPRSSCAGVCAGLLTFTGACGIRLPSNWALPVVLLHAPQVEVSEASSCFRCLCQISLLNPLFLEQTPPFQWWWFAGSFWIPQLLRSPEIPLSYPLFCRAAAPPFFLHPTSVLDSWRFTGLNFFLMLPYLIFLLLMWA